VLSTYVRDGIYAVDEARELLGIDSVPGGDRPMIFSAQDAAPLGGTATAAGTTAFRKYNPDVEAEPRVPAGNPEGGQWTNMSSSAVSPPTTESAAKDKNPQQAFIGELIDQRSDGVDRPSADSACAVRPILRPNSADARLGLEKPKKTADAKNQESLRRIV
jgi:hypothetical protein